MIKNSLLLIFALFILKFGFSQTPLTEAINFHIKTVYGEPIWLFPILDDEDKIVVVDFFSTTCGPCHDYAPDFQACYENFGYNEGNVFFVGINWGNDNIGVIEFDSIYGLTYPTASGSEGGGNITFNDYEILSYPTVIVITPDHNIVEQYVWPPDVETITEAVVSAGGILVNTAENRKLKTGVVTYPNPVSSLGYAEINLSKQASVQLSLINQFGQVVYKSDFEQLQSGISQLSFNTNNLKNGYYFVRIENKSGLIGSGMVSVVH